MDFPLKSTSQIIWQSLRSVFINILREKSCFAWPKTKQRIALRALLKRDLLFLWQVCLSIAGSVNNRSGRVLSKLYLMVKDPFAGKSSRDRKSSTACPKVVLLTVFTEKLGIVVATVKGLWNDCMHQLIKDESWEFASSIQKSGLVECKIMRKRILQVGTVHSVHLHTSPARLRRSNSANRT